MSDPKQLLSDSKDSMAKQLSRFKHHLERSRSGRASITLVDSIHVSYYGTSTPLAQLATLQTPDPRTLVISPYDRAIVPDVEKAILMANIGLNPSSDGGVIRIHVPPLSQQRREEIVKSIRASSEDAKVALRSIRKTIMNELKSLEKEKLISSDELNQWQKQVQELTDRFSADIKAATDKKVENILKRVDS